MKTLIHNSVGSQARSSIDGETVTVINLDNVCSSAPSSSATSAMAGDKVVTIRDFRVKTVTVTYDVESEGRRRAIRASNRVASDLIISPRTGR